MSEAYVIGHIKVKDEAKWNEYRSLVPATLQPWGAELIFRAELSKVLFGEHDFTDTVVIRFPDMPSLNNWHSSPEYQSLVALRIEAADVNLLAYEV